MRRNTRHSGFTLLEIVVAISILALMVGMLGPMTAAMINRAKYDASAERVNAIGDAIYLYVEDTLQTPSALKDIAEDPGVAGWAGPYLTDGYVADSNGIADFELDAFRNQITMVVVDSETITLTSNGAVASSTSDDIARTINLAPIRRTVTKKNIDIVNTAILAFNKGLGSGDTPLSATISAAFSQLVGGGYLPNDATLIVDGWGDELTGDPAGLSPLVAVTSQNLGSSGGGSGSGPGSW